LKQHGAFGGIYAGMIGETCLDEYVNGVKRPV